MARKIHYREPEPGVIYTACGRRIFDDKGGATITSDETKVTCKSCISAMARKAERETERELAAEPEIKTGPVQHYLSAGPRQGTICGRAYGDLGRDSVTIYPFLVTCPECKAWLIKVCHYRLPEKSETECGVAHQTVDNVTARFSYVTCPECIKRLRARLSPSLIPDTWPDIEDTQPIEPVEIDESESGQTIIRSTVERVVGEGPERVRVVLKMENESVESLSIMIGSHSIPTAPDAFIRYKRPPKGLGDPGAIFANLRVALTLTATTANKIKASVAEALSTLVDLSGQKGDS